MKTQYRNMLWLAALPLAFAMGACQNEELAETRQSVNIEGKTVLRATMGSYNTPQGRAQVELGNEEEAQEVFMWNEEDAFMVYNQEEPSVSSLFTISGYDEWNNPSAEATFIGEGEISEGTKVTAIYPAPDASAVKDGVVTLAFADPYGTSMGDNSELRIEEYMKTHMLMYATATMEGATTSLTFQHLCAMARVSYTNATGTDQKITEVEVGTGTNCMNHSMTFNLKDNTYEVNKNSASVRLTFSDLTVASGRTVDFYLLFIPSGNLLGNADTVKVSINDYKVGMPASEIASQKFEAGKRYWFKVMQTQAGLNWNTEIEKEGLITNLPLISIAETENGVQFEKDENGFVDVNTNSEKIAQVTSLNLSQQVDNIEGLEYFTSLKELYLSNMGLRSLDVSQMLELTHLDCSENELTALDVTQNDNLEVLNCNSNNLSKLDLSKNVALTDLHCCENSLGTLDLINNENLLVLDCFNAGLSELNLKNNTKLLSIYCGLNQLKELDVSQNKYLRYVDLTFGRDYGYGDSETPANYMTSLDFSNNPEIYYLRVSNCQLLTSLNISKNSKLLCLECGETSLSELNVSGNPLLETLVCTNNKQLKTLDVSNNLDLERLNCSWSGLISLDLSKNTSLVSLECSCEDLTSLNVSSNSLLQFLDCRYSGLTELDLSANVELTHLECNNAYLSELDITNNSKLVFRDEGGNCNFYCGRQYDDNYNYIPLILYLTSEQLSKWEDVQREGGNEEVNPVVQEPSSN